MKARVFILSEYIWAGSKLANINQLMSKLSKFPFMNLISNGKDCAIVPALQSKI